MKYLECPDLHFAPEYAETFNMVSEAICSAAIKNEVAFIALPGDLFERPIYATERGGINELRRHVKKWSNICPVVSVYGTPSHEAPGSLDALIDSGLIVLHPGNVYGLFDYIGNGEYTVIDINNNNNIATPLSIIFGTPELSKKTIQAQLSLTAEEANAAATNLFSQYIQEFVAPMRLKYESIPAFMLFHGVVCDSKKEHSDDIIIRASDIVIHSEDFIPANLTRVSLGHIHKPWESEIINAGYSGSWGSSWNEKGFIPAMTLIDTESNPVRLPYGTPKRLKIISPLTSYDPEIAYWLDSKDENASLPDSVHPWSRVTFNPDRMETRRVSDEQAATAKSLRAFFKIADPNVSEKILQKVDMIETIIKPNSIKAINLSMQSVEVSGCILFKGKTAKLDLSKYPVGVNGLRGNNGAGKSSILSFCSPYPVVIGKDTDSGRTSAIKDFFNGKDSYIKKEITVNGLIHTHLITIKAAHTQSPKVECYITIDGQPQLDKGTFDEMFQTCEEIYGSFNDYLLTSFYVQPLQGKTGSSLMSATMTDIRDLVQSIAGIDREQEKRYALDQVSMLAESIKKSESWLSTAREFQVDIDDLNNQIIVIQSNIKTKQDLLSSIEAKGFEHKKVLENLTNQKIKSDSEYQRKTENSIKTTSLCEEKSIIESKIESLKTIANNIDSYKKQLSIDDDAKKVNAEIEAVCSRNRIKKSEYDQAVNAELSTIRDKNRAEKIKYEDEKREIEQEVFKLTNSIMASTLTINSINHPCPKCGYIQDEDELIKHKSLLSEMELKLNPLKEKLESLFPPVDLQLFSSIDLPNYENEAQLLPIMTASTRNAIEQKLLTAGDAPVQIATLQGKLEGIKNQIIDIENQFYNIDDTINQKVIAAQYELNETRKEYELVRDEISILNARLSSVNESIKNANEVSEKIKFAETDLAKYKIDNEDWAYIAKMLQPSKVPAIELDMVLDAIDSEASRIIEPFLEAKYQIRTETQQQGKSGTVDKFDILIHDSETGIDKSFLKHSPGEKAFFNDAYVKALVRQRNERAHRHYDPIIMDEADGPIQPERVSEYYEMQRRYWKSNRVLVVSHSPASHEYIESVIKMEDVVK